MCDIPLSDLERIYLRIAEGDRDDAMALFFEAFGRHGLRPPHDKLRRQANIQRGRDRENHHVQN